MKKLAAALALLAILPTFLSASENGVYERRVYETRHVNPSPPLLDGILDDACWDEVEWAGDFVQ